MKRSDNAQRAFEELRQLGVPVYDWGEADGYPANTAFIFDWQNDKTEEVFADNTGRYLREDYVDGHYVNPLGYRQDVHEILAKHNLVTDWFSNAQIVVYNDPDAAGFHHGREKQRADRNTDA